MIYQNPQRNDFPAMSTFLRLFFSSNKNSDFSKANQSQYFSIMLSFFYLE